MTTPETPAGWQRARVTEALLNDLDHRITCPLCQRPVLVQKDRRTGEQVIVSDHLLSCARHPRNLARNRRAVTPEGDQR